MENVVKTEKEYERQATIAEKWDALSLTKFWNILTFGQFVRLLEYEKAQVGQKFPAKLQEIMEKRYVSQKQTN